MSQLVLRSYDVKFGARVGWGSFFSTCCNSHTMTIFFLSDETKRRSALHKLATLHKGLGNCAEAVSCYSRLLASYDANNPSDARIITELLLEITVYLLHEKTLSEDAWEMVSKLCAISASRFCKFEDTLARTAQEFLFACV